MEHITIWDYPDALIVSAILVWAYFSNVRASAMFSAGSFLLFHTIGRLFLGEFGGSLEPVVAASILGCAIGTAHLTLKYSFETMLIGISYLLIAVLGGLVQFGFIGVTFHQGPGFDFWTITTLLTWGACIPLIISIWRARDGKAIRSNSR